MRTTSQRGLELIRVSEGLELTAYLCPAGRLTIGYGHTGKDVATGMSITSERAEQLLHSDVYAAETWLNKSGVALEQGQFDALVSFAFNLGLENLKDSTLWKLVAAGDTTRAADQFARWVHSGSQVLPGLVKRRARERQLFITGDWE